MRISIGVSKERHQPQEINKLHDQVDWRAREYEGVDPGACRHGLSDLVTRVIHRAFVSGFRGRHRPSAFHTQLEVQRCSHEAFTISLTRTKRGIGITGIEHTFD
jgi:hypothetical protein